MSNTLKSAVRAHAETAQLALDNAFVAAIITSVKNLGVLNPKIPNSYSQATLKTLSPKVRRGHDLLGISAFSVPVVQKYDYAGGNAAHFRAFRFLVSPFEFDGKRMTVIDDAVNDGPASAVMREIVGDDWAMCVAAVKEHLGRHVQSPFVDRSEPQIFWETSTNSPIVSPLADTLPIELAARLQARHAAGQRFVPPLYFEVGGDKFQNSGVVSTLLAGNLPKLMSMPPSTQREITPLPTPVDGRYLAIEFDCVGFNVTGSGISGGFGNVTAALGFAEALRRKLGGAGLEIEPAGVVLGFSNTNFHGELKDGAWSYSVKKGIRQTAAGKTVPLPVAELTANARAHVVIRLTEPLAASAVDLVATEVGMLRFAGGNIFIPVATVVEDLDEVLDDWGGQVWLVANRQQEIEGEADRLDAALDRLQAPLLQSDGGNHRYGLAAIGYQGIEPPRPRNGTRDAEYRHIFAGPIVGLMEWVPAAGNAGDSIFWNATWNRVAYSCIALTLNSLS